MTLMCHCAIPELATSMLLAFETINTCVFKPDFGEFQFLTLNAIPN